MAEFSISQVTAGAGTPGRSRHDLVAGEVITLTATAPSASGVSYAWRLIDKAGSTAVLSAATGQTVTIGVAGAIVEPCGFEIELVVNDNGNVTSTRRIASVRSANAGLRLPLFSESAPKTHTLDENDPDDSTDNALYASLAGLGASAQNWRGWAEWAYEVVLAVEAGGGGGSGTGDVVGPGTATDNALARFNTSSGKLIQNSTATLSDAGLLTVSSLSVSTNISVGGTVDNRDIAADGAILDVAILDTDFAGTSLGRLTRTGSGTYAVVKDNLAGGAAPTVSDDNTAGYGVGSLWVYPGTGIWMCTSASTGAAAWSSLVASGGGDLLADGSVPMTGDFDLDSNGLINLASIEIDDDFVITQEAGTLLTAKRLMNSATGDEVGWDAVVTVNKATSGYYTGFSWEVIETGAPEEANVTHGWKVDGGYVLYNNSGGGVVVSNTLSVGNGIDISSGDLTLTSGTVVGLVSGSDNQIARLNSTNALQASLPTIDDSGSITIPTGQMFKVSTNTGLYLGGSAASIRASGTTAALFTTSASTFTAGSRSLTFNSSGELLPDDDDVLTLGADDARLSDIYTRALKVGPYTGSQQFQVEIDASSASGTVAFDSGFTGGEWVSPSIYYLAYDSLSDYAGGGIINALVIDGGVLDGTHISAVGGSVRVQGGNSPDVGTIAGGAVSIVGGYGSDGGGVSITAGPSEAGDAGDLTLDSGPTYGGGAKGAINIGTTTAEAINIGNTAPTLTTVRGALIAQDNLVVGPLTSGEVTGWLFDPADVDGAKLRVSIPDDGTTDPIDFLLEVNGQGSGSFAGPALKLSAGDGVGAAGVGGNVEITPGSGVSGNDGGNIVLKGGGTTGGNFGSIDANTLYDIDFALDNDFSVDAGGQVTLDSDGGVLLKDAGVTKFTVVGSTATLGSGVDIVDAHGRYLTPGAPRGVTSGTTTTMAITDHGRGVDITSTDGEHLVTIAAVSSGQEGTEFPIMRSTTDAIDVIASGVTFEFDDATFGGSSSIFGIATEGTVWCRYVSTTRVKVWGAITAELS